METRQQIQNAYLLRTLFFCVGVSIGCVLVYLAFAGFDVIVLGSVYPGFIAVFSLSFYWLKRAEALSKALSIEGSISSPSAPPDYSDWHSSSLPTPERPPRSIP